MINMMQICEVFEMNHIDKGTEIKICNQGVNSVFFLKKGTIKIVNQHNNHVKYIVKHGNIFGELALFNEEKSREDIAYALEDSIICYIKSP